MNIVQGKSIVWAVVATIGAAAAVSGAPEASRRVQLPLRGERTSRVADADATAAEVVKPSAAPAANRAERAVSTKRSAGVGDAKGAKAVERRARGDGSARASRHARLAATAAHNGVGSVKGLRRPSSAELVPAVPQRTRTITNRTKVVK